MMIDDCFRLGKTKNRRPVLIKFTSKLIMDCVLERSKLLKGTGIYLERDYDTLTREIRRQLVPFMKEARYKGKHAVLRDDKIIVEGRKLDLNFCKKNLGKKRSEEPVDQPGEGRGEIVTIAEGGQSSNNERRSIHTRDDVSDKSLLLGEMVTTAEEGQRCNNEYRATHISDDVSNKSLKSSAGSLNMWIGNGRGNARQECQVSMEVISTQQTLIERYRSRLNSGENTVSVGYRKRVNQPVNFN